ncbi:NUDIX hydrolase [Nocardioides aequoreus]|uniref:NUDIX hydrolase n=1 Tax=Nocardioides aequoreus TaxID=397278 RepID=UPI00056D6AE1|nr:NUDIX domain-containing protein [Nocardioides aequoreus]
MAPPARPEPRGPEIVAAGAVVVRKGPDAREVLVVHRPKYDDWSFPKGKQDPGEHVTATAVREVVEETGVEVRLGRPLRPQLYAVGGGRAKRVHYWVGHVVGDDDLTTYEVNAEVDGLAWVPVDEAASRLTYLDDIALLDQLYDEPRPTTAVVVVRHAKALKRGQWRRADWKRPLSDVGQEQARRLRDLLRSYGVTQVVSSSATRCLETVAPYAEQQVLPVQELPELSEEAYDAAHARRVLHALREAREPSVVCSHRPILPDLLADLGTEEEPLAPGELVVCHHRRGRLVATERHLPGLLA